MGRIQDIGNKYFKDNTTTEETRSNPPQAFPVNRYTIQVDIQGMVLLDVDGCVISYREISDYVNSNFPARILSISLHPRRMAELLNMQKEQVNGFGELYNIKLFVTPLSDEGVLNKAFEDGEFKGIMLSNDSAYEIEEAIDEESKIYNMTSLEPRVTVSFQLYRQNELTFSTSNGTNFLYPNPTVSAVFINSLLQSNPSLKCIVSKFDHDPNLGLFLVRHMSFTDLIELLEDEVGFYKTDYICFIEYGILFFLNKSNEINVTNKELERSLHIFAGRVNQGSTSKFISKMDDYNYGCTVANQNVKIFRDTKSSIRKSYSYITPSGKKIDYINSLSRNIETVRKLTEAVPIQKTYNIQYEIFDAKIDDNSVNFLNPLSKITYLDSNNVKRTYRMARKEISVVSSQSSYIRVSGFRIL